MKKLYLYIDKKFWDIIAHPSQKKYVGKSNEKSKKVLRYAPELVALSLGNNCEIRELLDSQLTTFNKKW